MMGACVVVLMMVYDDRHPAYTRQAMLSAPHAQLFHERLRRSDG